MIAKCEAQATPSASDVALSTSGAVPSVASTVLPSAGGTPSSSAVSDGSNSHVVISSSITDTSTPAVTAPVMRYVQTTPSPFPVLTGHNQASPSVLSNYSVRRQQLTPAQTNLSQYGNPALMRVVAPANSTAAAASAGSPRGVAMVSPLDDDQATTVVSQPSAAAAGVLHRAATFAGISSSSSAYARPAGEQFVIQRTVQNTHVSGSSVARRVKATGYALMQNMICTRKILRKCGNARLALVRRQIALPDRRNIVM